MRTTLAQIEAFYWIARLGGFHAAATHLNISQPTISLRIRAFERTLGVRLFERTGRKIRISQEAADLLPQAERMILLAGELSTRHTAVDPLRGRLRLGAPDTFALTCMPDLLATLKLRYPELNVALTVDNSTVLGAKLNRRELDVAVLVDPEVEAHVRVVPVGAMRFVWVGSRRLGLPRREVRPGDLAGYEIFTNPEPSHLMTLLRNWFATAGIKPSRLSTCNNLSVILKLTLSGAGVSLLPRSILPADIDTDVWSVLKPNPETARVRLCVAYQIDKEGPSVKAVLDGVRETIARSPLAELGAE
jgi:DNA-binding transcriptional LysR family regulator